MAVYKNYIVELKPGFYHKYINGNFEICFECIIRVDFEGDLEGILIEVPLKDLRELTEEKKASLL